MLPHLLLLLLCPAAAPAQFTLRHEYRIDPDSHAPLRTDLRPGSAPPAVLLNHRLRPKPTLPNALARHSPALLFQAQSPLPTLPVPAVSDKHTLAELARMASNAYLPGLDSPDWVPVGAPWNKSHHFGWERAGLRGHVFVDHANATVVIALKGTSAVLFGGGKTSARDKTNDNLLFSCCCARISYAWKTVCDCYSSANSCSQSCLEQSLQSQDSYYNDALTIYHNVSSIYPAATIWLVGHSLGGAIASLLGLTFGLPTVTFEAPGELLAAQRLHLPLPPAIPASETNIWHIGHTGDPIFMGVCTGPASSCWYAGYAMETHCHTGLECVYDTVADKGWRIDIRSHSILPVINDVILAYDDVPTCKEVKDCVDCFAWTFQN